MAFDEFSFNKLSGDKSGIEGICENMPKARFGDTNSAAA